MNKYNVGFEAVLAPVLSGVGAMLPDIDHDKTKIGRQRKLVTNLTNKLFNLAIIAGFVIAAIIGGLTIWQGVNFGVSLEQILLVFIGGGGILFIKKKIENSKTFKWAVKHRGFMHTLWVPAFLLFNAVTMQAPILAVSFFSLFVGYMSHLFVDMQNVGGCPILYPILKVNIRILRIPTKNVTACNVACAVCCLLFMAYSFISVNGFSAVIGLFNGTTI